MLVLTLSALKVLIQLRELMKSMDGWFQVLYLPIIIVQALFETMTISSFSLNHQLMVLQVLRFDQKLFDYKDIVFIKQSIYAYLYQINVIILLHTLSNHLNNIKQLLSNKQPQLQPLAHDKLVKDQKEKGLYTQSQTQYVLIRKL